MRVRRKHEVAEFFAGAGLARMGLEGSQRFRVVWANDIDKNKARLYRAQFGTGFFDHLSRKDIRDVRAGELPRSVDLAWASFPCTDLSLAGNRKGLAGEQSSTWWAFIDCLESLDSLPPVIVAENVVGLATSNRGRDLHALLCSLNRLGYVVDVLAIDARHFVPQSRVRLFIVGAQETGNLSHSSEGHATRPKSLTDRIEAFGVETFRPELPDLPTRTITLADRVERLPEDSPIWWDTNRRRRFEAELSPIQVNRLEGMRRSTGLVWRTAYRRTRKGKIAWEIRADDIAGCLRTVRGGSSRQAVVEAGYGDVRVRWMTPREYAGLMGAPEYAVAGFRPSQVFSGFGDAVVVPVVDWLATGLLDRLLR